MQYKNLPMQYTVISKVVKNENFPYFRFLTTLEITVYCMGNIQCILLIFAQNIDCGYLLDPPRQGGSNEYPQSML